MQIRKKKIKSPIRYFGGKGNMLNKITAHFPQEEMDLYVEPFCGSFVVGLNIVDVPIVLNDLNGNVYAFWKILSDTIESQEFLDAISIMPYHERIRADALARLKENDYSSDYDRAIDFFTANRMSRNGIGGLANSVILRAGTSKAASDFKSSKQSVVDAVGVLANCLIYNRNARDIIAKYDKPKTFIYCDPPYVHSTRGETRYPTDMDDEAHIEFLDTICNVKHAKILVSGYSNPLYSAKLAHWDNKSFDVLTVSGTNHSKKRNEHLWANYTLPHDII